MPKFLAVYTGAPMPDGGPPPMGPADMQRGMNEWMGFMQKNASKIVEQGGPLGRTKKVSKAGVEDIRNRLAGYVVIEADSAEAAADLFLNHPHFSVFPGEAVEVMPVLPIPTMP